MNPHHEREMAAEDIQFRHAVKIQTRFNDFDMFGHANNGAYLQYCDVAKLAYFSQFLDGGHFDPTSTGMVIASIKCDFIHQIVPSDEVEVLSAVTHIGNTSLVLEQRVVSNNRRQLHASVRNIMVQFDPSAQSTVPISELWRNRFIAFEGHPL